jgi:hypothetical protein
VDSSPELGAGQRSPPSSAKNSFVVHEADQADFFTDFFDADVLTGEQSFVLQILLNDGQRDK